MNLLEGRLGTLGRRDWIAGRLAALHEIPKSSLPEFRDTIHFRELKRFVFVPSLTDFTSVGESLAVVPASAKCF